MKYTGILTTLSVMTAFVAFSSASMAENCTIKNCSADCVAKLKKKAKCDITTEEVGALSRTTTSKCTKKRVAKILKAFKGAEIIECKEGNKEPAKASTIPVK